jgi:hypothetical protein
MGLRRQCRQCYKIGWGCRQVKALGRPGHRFPWCGAVCAKANIRDRRLWREKPPATLPPKRLPPSARDALRHSKVEGQTALSSLWIHGSERRKRHRKPSPGRHPVQEDFRVGRRPPGAILRQDLLATIWGQSATNSIGDRSSPNVRFGGRQTRSRCRSRWNVRASSASSPGRSRPGGALSAGSRNTPPRGTTHSGDQGRHMLICVNEGDRPWKTIRDLMPISPRVARCGPPVLNRYLRPLLPSTRCGNTSVLYRGVARQGAVSSASNHEWLSRR